MKYLSTSKDFLSESVLIKLLNETVIYYSPDARKLLGKIEDVYQLPIATDLIWLEGEEKEGIDMTMIDVSSDGKYFTYKTSRNLDKLSDEIPEFFSNVKVKDFYKTKTDSPYTMKRFLDSGYPDSPLWQNPAGQIKIGRFIITVFGSKYNNNQVEDFSLKLRMKKTGQNYVTKVVEGDEIKKWYNEANNIMSGTLESSCMRYGHCSSYFDIYVKNPEICKMVCIFEDDLLAARALIWKITTKSEGDFEWYMDRRYYAYEELDNKLKDYAIQNGWAFKTVNSYSNIKSVTLGTKGFDCDMEIKLDNYKSITKFPYVDTFKKFYPETGILKNSDSRTAEEVEFYLLDSTGGGYTPISPDGDKLKVKRPNTEKDEIFSSWYDSYISLENAIWSDWHHSWIDETDAIFVTIGEYRGCYPNDSEDLVYLDHLGKYANRDDATYSDYYGEYLFADDAVEAICYVNELGEADEECQDMLKTDADFVDMSEVSNFMWWDYFDRKNGWHGSGFNKEVLTKDYTGVWILKRFSVKTYQLVDRSHFFSHITEEDAKTLGLEIDKSKGRVEDAIGYDDDICRVEDWYNKIIQTADKIRKERLEDLKTGKY
jgi:hypothetical protein